MRKNIFLFLILGVLNIQNIQSQTVDTIVDHRDGNIYKIVKIGNQVWMAENLRFKSNESWCYANKPENGNLYGLLYSWDAAKNSCPAGWHLPSDLEWQTLEKFLGMPESDLSKNKGWRGTDQGKRLISDSNIGFNLLFGGYKNPPSNFNLLKSQAFFWTSSEENGSAWLRQLYEGSTQIFRQTRPLNWCFSVRCVKN